MNKKLGKFIGIFLAAGVVILCVVLFCLFFLQKKPAVAPPGYLTGLVASDRTVLVLGSDYQLVCMPDVEVSDGLRLIESHASSGVSHVIVPSGSSHVVHNLTLLLDSGCSVGCIYAPEGAKDSEEFAAFTQQYPQIPVTYLKALSRYAAIGDLLLTKKDLFSEDLTYTLTHGEETYLFAEDPVKGGKYSLIVMPLSSTMESTCRGEFAFVVNNLDSPDFTAHAMDALYNNSLATNMFINESGEFFSMGSDPVDEGMSSFFALSYEVTRKED